MFDVILDYFKRIMKSRLFPITLIYLVLFGVIINHLFVLQIVEGPERVVQGELKYLKEREIKSTRGNIYDRNGKLLASNVLSYSVVMEDTSVSTKEYNAIINRLIKIIEGNGNTLDNEFYIIQNDKGEFEFTIEGPALSRFLKKVFTYLEDEDGNLKEEFIDYQDATAEEVYEYLRIGTGDSYTHMFGISDEYSVEEALKIMSIRYALFCNYPKYIQITVASNVSDITVAAVKESSAKLQGVKIEQQSSRVYEDSKYFAHILGYTGLISADELEDKENENKESENNTSNIYNSTDVIGKTGLEQKYEQYLAGTKGSEIVTLNSSGKVVSVEKSVEPIAGNDIYLTIDRDLQKNVYNLLEKHITQILLTNIVPSMSYGSKGESASDITIPIYEVYNALINNNIIDIGSFEDADASTLEKSTHQKYISDLNNVFAKYDNLLKIDNTVTNDKAGDMEDFLDYFYKSLKSNNLILKDSIPAEDATYKAYVENQISLSKFLQYALSNNWIDLSAMEIGEEYYSAEELYQKLIDDTKNHLKTDPKFKKMIYRNLIFSYKLSGTEICLLLFDQGVLEYKEGDENSLKNGSLSAYKFITDKIRSLEITPAMLALEPCSGSVVITDVNNGDVLALVTYPSYDNNLLANKVDPKYYKQLLNDNTFPLNNRPLTEGIAPGSTFKMVTSVAALEEGVITPTNTIYDKGVFDKLSQGPKCHIYPSSHGNVDIVDALKVSCNYFFYEMGWRLGLDSNGKYNSDLGLSKLNKYASLFGLNEKSGIELYEAEPEISTKDAVRSAIGQGSNDYTPVQISRYITTIANRGTCYNLTLLNKIEDKDGKVILDNSATVNHDLTNFSDSTWNAVFEGMNSVVNVYGGSVYNEFHNFGVTVAGKTGTSQISTTHPNNALFVSFAPYEAPEISVTSVIPNGYTSHNAASLSKDIYSLYFDLKNTDSLIDGNVTEDNSNIGSAIE